jgi:hypothetical protein
VEFEYDPAKSKTNAKKHGIDFEQATLLWNDEKRVEFVARFADEPPAGLGRGTCRQIMDGDFHHPGGPREDHLREKGEKK